MTKDIYLTAPLKFKFCAVVAGIAVLTGFKARPSVFEKGILLSGPNHLVAHAPEAFSILVVERDDSITISIMDYNKNTTFSSEIEQLAADLRAIFWNQ